MFVNLYTYILWYLYIYLNIYVCLLVNCITIKYILAEASNWFSITYYSL